MSYLKATPYIVRTYGSNDELQAGLNEMHDKGYLLHSWKTDTWQDQWFATCIFEKK